MNTIELRRSILVFLCVSALSLPWVATADISTHPLWLRYPAVSPDSSTIAFTYQGQIWLVPSTGGEAVPLTGGGFYSSGPIWSPDGSNIAFWSTRHGNRDVFVVPAKGGEVKRLTTHSVDDVPMAFSPDGKRVYFVSARLGDPDADGLDSIRGIGPLMGQVYSVPSTGGRSRLELPTTALEIQWDRAGKRMLYTDNPSPVESIWRKHEVSDAAQNIWIYDIATKTHRMLTDWHGEDRNPIWSADERSFLWLSERSGSFNVWRRSLSDAEPEQVTFHEKWPVRFLSSAKDGTVVYGWDGGIWCLKPAARKPDRVPINIRQQSLVDGPSLLDVTAQASEMAVSPNGKEIAIVARGEIFVVSQANGAARRITQTTGMERFPSFSPDGRRLLYATERTGKWAIVEARLTDPADTGFTGAAPFKEVMVVDEDKDAYQPVYSPTGDRFAYVYDRTIIKVHECSSGKSVEVLPRGATYSYSDGDMQFGWSPDGRSLVARTGFEATSEVEILDASGQEPRRNVSQNGFLDMNPAMSTDGTIVVWLSDRNGLRSTDAQPAQADVYAAFLTREAYETYGGQGLSSEVKPESKHGSGSVKKPASGILPDLEGIDLRTLRLTPFSMDLVYYGLTPDNRSLIVVAGQVDGTEAGYVIDTRTHAMRKLFTGPRIPGTVYQMDAKATMLYALAGSRVTVYDLASDQSTPIAFRAELNRDVREEVQSIFQHNWRMTSQTFYDPKMQGVDWQAVGDHYRKFVPDVIHWEDLAEILGEMMGELNASHQWALYIPDTSRGDQTASLGLYYDPSHMGPGMRIKKVLPGGPADRKGSNLVPGSVILAVDGVAITPDMDIDPLLNRKDGKPVRLSVQSAKGDKSAEEIVTPVNLTLENSLAYRRWIITRRDLVERLSKGRIGYVHVPGMNLASYQKVYGDVFGRYRDAEALIVDVRHNGGGNLHDQLIAMLTGRHDSSLVSRYGAEVLRNPVGRFTGPSAVIVNASSYSDGSVFPALYQHKKIGALVGSRVPGTGTAVMQTKQIEPRLAYTIPVLGFRFTDGAFFENREIEPDILVYNDPNSVAAGRDLQLERAVEHLLDILRGGKL